MNPGVSTATVLESLLGDPFDDGLLPFAQTVSDEERSRLRGEAGDALRATGLVASLLLPRSVGGSCETMRAAVAEGRALFRRDPASGLELVTAPLALHATAVDASDPVAAEAFGVLLSGGGAAATLAESRQPPRVRGGLLRGRTPLLVVPETAASWYIPSVGHDGAELLAICPAQESLVLDPPTGTVGLRGTRFATATALDAPVLALPHGPQGRERARAVLAAMAIATLDTSLRLAVRYAAGRELYGGTVLDIPHARGLIAEVHTDLLVADALTDSALAAIDAGTPDAVQESAVVALVPRLLTEAMRALSVLFGSTFYARVAPYAVFETLLRDVDALALAGLGRHPSDISVAALGAVAVQPDAGRRGAAREALGIDGPAAGGEVASAIDAATIVAWDACHRRHASGDTAASAAWLEAATIQLRRRLRGHGGVLSDAMIEGAITDVVACADQQRSMTFDRVPVFG